MRHECVSQCSSGYCSNIFKLSAILQEDIYIRGYMCKKMLVRKCLSVNRLFNIIKCFLYEQCVLCLIIHIICIFAIHNVCICHEPISKVFDVCIVQWVWVELGVDSQPVLTSPESSNLQVVTAKKWCFTISPVVQY